MVALGGSPYLGCLLSVAITAAPVPLVYVYTCYSNSASSMRW